MEEFSWQNLVGNLLLARVLYILYAVLYVATEIAMIAQSVACHLGAY